MGKLEHDFLILCQPEKLLLSLSVSYKSLVLAYKYIKCSYYTRNRFVHLTYLLQIINKCIHIYFIFIDNINDIFNFVNFDIYRLILIVFNIQLCLSRCLVQVRKCNSYFLKHQTNQRQNKNINYIVRDILKYFFFILFLEWNGETFQK